MPTAAASLLLNPHTYDPSHLDEESRRLLLATVDHLEGYGLDRLTQDWHDKVWYTDFLEFVAKEKVFATFMTPARDAAGDAAKRWDTARVAAMSEVLGFYGLSYWYPWQVTCLGLGPVWQSDNAAARTRAAAAIDAGGVAAFGLSEKEHGADIYSSDMVLTPNGDGAYSATGGKYYIGNGNCAATVSVFGRIDGVEGADQYVFFYADSNHPAYTVVRNVVPSQNYVVGVPPRRLPGDGRGHPAHRRGGVQRGAQHRQRRQVQPQLRLDRARARNAFFASIAHAHHRSSTASRSPTCRTSAARSSRTTHGWSR